MPYLKAPLSQCLQRLLALTQYASPPGPLCRDCLDQDLREELASLARSQDGG